MERIEHHFVAGLRADHLVRYAVAGAAQERWDEAHLLQSPLDRGCGTFSFLQAAMVLLRIPRRQVERISTVKRGPLHALFQQMRSHHFVGTTHRDIARYCEAFAPALTCDAVVSSSSKRIGDLAADAIATGAVPLLRFDTKGSRHKWDHWVMACGMEIVAGATGPRALLALDPACPVAPIAFYNARLALKPDRPATGRIGARTLPYRYWRGDVHQVRLRELVVVRRAQAP